MGTCARAPIHPVTERPKLGQLISTIILGVYVMTLLPYWCTPCSTAWVRSIIRMNFTQVSLWQRPISALLIVPTRLLLKKWNLVLGLPVPSECTRPDVRRLFEVLFVTTQHPTAAVRPLQDHLEPLRSIQVTP